MTIPNQPTKQPSKRAAIDWETVERDYRAGIKSLKAIGNDEGVSDAGIIKRAKRDGWERDLRAKIQAKAAAKVSAAMVSAEVSAERKVSERQVIEANAELQKGIILSHRTDAVRSRKLTMSHFAELEMMAEGRELLSNLAEIVSGGDEVSDKQIELFRKTISFGSRVTSLKNLIDSLKTTIGIERQAFGLENDGEKSSTGTLESLLESISRDEQ